MMNAAEDDENLKTAARDNSVETFSSFSKKFFEDEAVRAYQDAQGDVDKYGELFSDKNLYNEVMRRISRTFYNKVRQGNK